MLCHVYNGKFRYSLAWRCLKATIILRLICIMPSASHVNHFDKLNSNGLRSRSLFLPRFLSLSLSLCSSLRSIVPGSLWGVSIYCSAVPTSYTAIQFFGIRYKVEYRQRVCQSYHGYSTYPVTKEIKNASLLLEKRDYVKYSNDTAFKRRRKTA